MRLANATTAANDSMSIQNLVGNGFPQVYATSNVMFRIIKNKPKKAAVKSINRFLMILCFTGKYFRLNLLNKFLYKMDAFM